MRTALLIATDTYTDPTFGALRAPALDAGELDGVLAHPDIGDFTTEVLVNASAQDVRERVDAVFGRADRDDLVLLYLSGHGVKDRSGGLYFAAPDTRHDLLASTSIPAAFVRGVIDRSKARKVVVWLDCCYGGAFPTGMSPRAAGQVDVLDQLDDGRGCVIMTSATHVQYAYEPDGSVRDETGPSVFTRAIVEGLRTGAADLDGDGEVSTADLYAYVYERLRRESPDQTPTTSGMIAGDLRIAHVGVRLPAGLPDELRRLVRSTDPEFRALGLRLLAERADTGDDVAARTLDLLKGDDTPTPARESDHLKRCAMLWSNAAGVAFSPDSSLFAASGIVWDTVAWQEVHSIRGLNPGEAAFSPDGTLLAQGLRLGPALYSTTSWTLKTRARSTKSWPDRSGRLSFGHDGRLIVQWAPGHKPVLWVSAGNRWQERPLPVDHLRSLHLSRSTPLLVTLAVDGVVEVFDTTTRRPTGGPSVPEPAATAVAISPDGRLLAVADDQRTELRRTSDRQVVTTLPRGVTDWRGLAFAPDGRLLATVDLDGVRLWSVPSGNPVQSLHTELTHIEFSPDGRFLAGIAGNGQVWLWSVDPRDLATLPERRACPPTTRERRARLRHIDKIAGRTRVATGAAGLSGTVAVLDAWFSVTALVLASIGLLTLVLAVPEAVRWTLAQDLRPGGRSGR
ncbi:caspase, EACC1-associated type [Saccharothrix violaceirubra]|uniref:DNA-binding beta-propeller fold protein YncE n=1 Tax=Saccharothrix violaceirubra TaxID=413306 RepID=A0A7W7T753_9PSEU|nr:caspase family protein [Saccharothrix violaceirubra]MBB4966465.1 DNA-binding beta-propeller fold protein YncE [Saccharothrix violaceirubra]